MISSTIDDKSPFGILHQSSLKDRINTFENIEFETKSVMKPPKKHNPLKCIH